MLRPFIVPGSSKIFLSPTLQSIFHKSATHTVYTLMCSSAAASESLFCLCFSFWMHTSLLVHYCFFGSLLPTCTVRACPHQRHMPAAHIFLQVDLKDVFGQVQGIRVVGSVHQDRLRVMIDGNVDISPQCHLNPDAGTTPRLQNSRLLNHSFHHPIPFSQIGKELVCVYFIDISTLYQCFLKFVYC